MSYNTNKPIINPPADASAELEAQLVSSYTTAVSKHISPTDAIAMGTKQLYSSLSRLPDENGNTIEMRLGTVNTKQPLNRIVDNILLGVSMVPQS